ncbi:acyloxyacyl hydrolase [Robertkochia solimangrovi]|uniref:acyloxyacyl hydrolase n=1 Tax=Robertkochia solimangrovi TaxID=2213046 RepID=UPI0011802F56|nr:acyloxyacyl hydrolase [Robertkochia solimangrovi]TRZ41272.1 hypothetical protein DMZ48_17730 [Robertkochia solimangrovi]
MRSCILFLISILFFAPLNRTYGQEKVETAKRGKYRSIMLRGHSGMHLYTGSDLDSKLDSGYGALEFRYGWQSQDADIWSTYGYPQYGIGAYTGFIGDPEIFGNPNAVFGFIDFPVTPMHKRDVLSVSPALGLTYHLNPYDAENNPLNIAIGARMAVYFSVGFTWTYKWTREMDLVTGIDFTHFSNGRSNTPNYGLNMFGIHLGMRYNYNADQNIVDPGFEPETLVSPRFKSTVRKGLYKPEEQHLINTYFAMGVVQNDFEAGTDTHWGTLSLLLEYQHKFNNMHSATIGFDFFNDNSLKAINEDPDDTSIYAVHAGYDFMFWRLTILVQAGIHLTDSYDKNNVFFRPAARYDINELMYAQIGLKANGIAADWIEFGIGFRPFRW